MLDTEIKTKNSVRESPGPSGSRVGNTMAPRKGGKPAPNPNDETETETDDEMEGGHPTSNVNTNKTGNKTPINRKKSAKFDALKTFKIQHKNITGLEQIVIPISNKYSLLAGKKDDEKQSQNASDDKRESKKQRIPPIIIQEAQRCDVVKQLKFLKIKSYRLKMTSTGINVFLESVDEFKKFRRLLSECKTPFFTHDLPEDKITRVVLKGLDYMDPQDVAKELEVYEVKPIDIKAQIPKQRRYTNHANFIVSYRKGDIKLKKVYAIKSLFHTIVRWEPYRSSFSGPTQCRRCLMPGHGTRHCSLPPHCNYCSGPHLSEECVDIGHAITKARSKRTEAERMEDDQHDAKVDKLKEIALSDFPAKCFNCIQAGFDQVGHIAFSPKCPSKQRFVQLQKRLSLKSSKTHRPQFALNETMFPPLPTNRNGVALRGQQQAGHNQQPSPSSFQRNQQQKFSDQARNMSFSSSFPTPNLPINDIKNDLFSFDEIMALVNELISKISLCSSRMEQFQVITSLTLKYVYGQSR